MSRGCVEPTAPASLMRAKGRPNFPMAPKEVVAPRHKLCWGATNNTVRMEYAAAPGGEAFANPAGFYVYTSLLIRILRDASCIRCPVALGEAMMKVRLADMSGVASWCREQNTL